MTSPLGHRSPAALAVTLLSGSDPSAVRRVAGILTGLPDTALPAELDLPGAGNAEFAAALAESLSSEARHGMVGESTVVLDPDADVMEVALVLEHVLESRQQKIPVRIREVVAVTSIDEILRELCVIGGSTLHESDLGSPGRLARRLEFAGLIVLTDIRADSAPAETALVVSLLALLSPAARIVSVPELEVVRPSACPLVRGRAHRLGASMGWQRQLGDRVAAASALEPVGAYVFRDPRPFHPGRLQQMVSDRLAPDRVGRIVRSRGFVRLASRPDRIGEWSSAGDVLDLDPTGMRSWDPESPIGQEIAFFGLDLDRRALEAELSGCLLEGDELAAGPTLWERYVDPFPGWATHHH
ncbi:CobW C-terminal domain-containing protein [Herbiconiux liukaitaii]|uniref:GTP-binding protein n=1 Tax=Herbiconiux liukaitaii TaxID=3342799 RepID=UPI0035B8DA1A